MGAEKLKVAGWIAVLAAGLLWLDASASAGWFDPTETVSRPSMNAEQTTAPVIGRFVVTPHNSRFIATPAQ